MSQRRASDADDENCDQTYKRAHFDCLSIWVGDHSGPKSEPAGHLRHAVASAAQLDLRLIRDAENVGHDLPCADDDCPPGHSWA